MKNANFRVIPDSRGYKIEFDIVHNDGTFIRSEILTNVTTSCYNAFVEAIQNGLLNKKEIEKPKCRKIKVDFRMNQVIKDIRLQQ